MNNYPWELLFCVSKSLIVNGTWSWDIIGTSVTLHLARCPFVDALLHFGLSLHTFSSGCPTQGFDRHGEIELEL